MTDNARMVGSWCSPSYRIGKRLRVVFRVEDGTLTATWDPARPARITGRLLRRYRDARDHFLAALGMRAAVVELHDGGRLEGHFVEPTRQTRH